MTLHTVNAETPGSRGIEDLDFAQTSLLLSAVCAGSLASVKVVLEIAGREVLEQRDQQNRTALVLATMGGHGEVVNYLLSEGGRRTAAEVKLGRREEGKTLGGL